MQENGRRRYTLLSGSSSTVGTGCLQSGAEASIPAAVAEKRFNPSNLPPLQSWVSNQPFFFFFYYLLLPVLAPAWEEPGLGWREMCCVWLSMPAPGVCILLAAFSSCTN